MLPSASATAQMGHTVHLPRPCWRILACISSGLVLVISKPNSSWTASLSVISHLVKDDPGSKLDNSVIIAARLANILPREMQKVYCALPSVFGRAHVRTGIYVVSTILKVLHSFCLPFCNQICTKYWRNDNNIPSDQESYTTRHPEIEKENYRDQGRSLRNQRYVNRSTLLSSNSL